MSSLVNKNIVIYTASSDNYDKLIQHTYKSKDFDYICFTDKKIKNPGIWQIKPINKRKYDSVRTARYYKLFPNKFLSNYKYSIWIDSNIDITNNILEERISELIKNNETISAGTHFSRHCIYQEAKTCIDLQKDEPGLILKQIKFLKQKKYPKNNGLFETGVIFRKHNDLKVIKTMEDWWWMIRNFSKRDQLSFNYALWKNKLKCKKLFPINNRLVSCFVFNTHNTKTVSTLYLYTKNNLDDNDFIQKILIISNYKFEIKFNLKKFTNINQVKLNILRNQFCRLKIKKIIFKDQKNTKKISLDKIEYQTNGKLLNNNFIDFKTSDPQIIFKTPQNIKQITFYGEIKLYNLEILYNQLKKKNDDFNQKSNQIEKNKLKNEIKDENTELKSRIKTINKEIKSYTTLLNKITRSKFYKVWQFYCRFKKILIK